MAVTTEKQMRPVHVTNKTAPNVPGRRSFFNYRDLGVTEATQGAMRAQITEAVTVGLRSLRWSLVVSGGLRWSPVVSGSLRWSPEVSGGLWWSLVVFGGLRGSP